MSAGPVPPVLDLDNERAARAARARSTASGVLEYDEVIATITEAYLDEIAPSSPTDPVPTPAEIKAELLKRVNARFAEINLDLKGHDRYTRLRVLTPTQIAHILMRLHHVVMIPSGMGGDKRYDLLGIYCDSGPDEGLYVTSDMKIDEIAMRYNRELTINAGKEIRNILRIHAPQRPRTTDPDLVPVNNGVVNYKTKELLPFSPEWVFLSKARTDFDPNATSPVIHNDEDGTDWDVDSWLAELFDDPEMVHLMWQIAGASVRPHVRWNRMAWFYSEVGNNGKGTFCELLRGLVGEQSCVSIPLTSFGQDFMLEPLQYASAIITDENDVGIFIDKVANLKAVVTNDVIQINRKGLVPISYRFWGFMVQCLNELPQIRDRSESFYRRQLFVPFEKSFTGAERQYIKNDYLHRPEVLRYVLKKVLVDIPDYYELSEPEATRKVLELYKEINDPVREFWNEFEDLFVWDLLPFPFLYDLYKAWFVKTNPSGKVIGRNRFIGQLLQVIRSTKDCKFYCTDQSKKVWTGNKMDRPEPLILTYDLTGWMQRGYTGKDPRQICTPDISPNYRGLERFGVDDVDDEDSGDQTTEI